MIDLNLRAGNSRNYIIFHIMIELCQNGIFGINICNQVETCPCSEKSGKSTFDHQL